MTFSSNLITYKNKLDNEAVRLQKYRKDMENKDLNKFTSRDISVFNTHQSLQKTLENMNCGNI